MRGATRKDLVTRDHTTNTERDLLAEFMPNLQQPVERIAQPPDTELSQGEVGLPAERIPPETSALLKKALEISKTLKETERRSLKENDKALPESTAESGRETMTSGRPKRVTKAPIRYGDYHCHNTWSAVQETDPVGQNVSTRWEDIRDKKKMGPFSVEESATDSSSKPGVSQQPFATGAPEEKVDFSRQQHSNLQTSQQLVKSLIAKLLKMNHNTSGIDTELLELVLGIASTHVSSSQPEPAAGIEDPCQTVLQSPVESDIDQKTDTSKLIIPNDNPMLELDSDTDWLLSELNNPVPQVCGVSMPEEGALKVASHDSGQILQKPVVRVPNKEVVIRQRYDQLLEKKQPQ